MGLLIHEVRHIGYVHMSVRMCGRLCERLIHANNMWGVYCLLCQKEKSIINVWGGELTHMCVCVYVSLH